MHSLLENQLREHLKDFTDPPEGWENFLQSISRVYTGLEQDRNLIEKSLDISADELTRRNEELRKQSEKLKKSQRLAGIGDWEFDLQNNHLVFSENVREMLGVDAEVYEREGNSLGDLVIPEDRPKVAEAIQKAITDKQPFEIVSRVKRPDERVVHLRLQGEIEFGSEGKPSRIIGVTQDVTVLKEADARFEAESKRNKQFLDAIPDMVFVKGPKSRIIWVNKAFQDYYGMDNSQLQGMIDASFNDPDYTQQYVKDDAYVFETGKTLEIPEEPVIRHDGQTRYFHSVKSAIFDEQGKVVMTIGISRDITEQRTAKIALEKSEQLYRLATKAISDVIWDIDYLKQTITWSEGIQNVFGFTEKELNTSVDWWTEHINSEDKERVMANFLESVNSDKDFWSNEYLFMQGNGTYTRVNDRGYIIRDESGKAIRIIGAMTDISKEYNAKKQLEMSATILKRAQRIAHVGNWEIDLQKGTMELSEEIFRILGMEPSAEPVEVKQFMKFIHPDDRAKSQSVMEAAVSTGSPIELDERIIRPDGAVRVLHIQAEVVKNAGEVRILGVAQDVTDERQNQVAVSRLAEIVESTDYAICSQDFNGIVLSWNNGAQKLLGYSASELVGKPIYSYIIPEGMEEESHGIMEKVKKGESVHNFVTKRKHKDGRLIDLSITYSPIKGALGEIAGVSVIARDIGSQKKFEEALKSRTLESERMNTLMIGRELKMIELKKELQQLKEELAKYSVQSAKVNNQHPLNTTEPGPAEINEEISYGT